MKKLFIVLIITAVAFASCGNKKAAQQPADNQETVQTGQAAPEATQPEATSGDAPNAQVIPAGSVDADITANSTAPADTAKPKGGTVKLTKTEFLKKIWNYETSPQEWAYLGNKPAIIDFYADWCAPCRQAAPILEELSHDFAGQVIVYKIDTQKEQELAAVFGIQSIPAFLYIPMSGKPVMTSGIGRSKEETKAMFTEYINEILLKGKVAGL